MTHSARTQFLEAAARAYVGTDPATSAHLMAQRNLETTRNVLSVFEDPSTPYCRACGMIQVPGRTSAISVSDGRLANRCRSTTKAMGKGKSEGTKSILVECLTCHRYVKSALPSSPEMEVKASAKAIASTKENVTRKTGKPTTGNAGSKQRAKARKGGLQAILEKSKQGSTSSVGDGLDLMNFLKQA